MTSICFENTINCRSLQYNKNGVPRDPEMGQNSGLKNGWLLHYVLLLGTNTNSSTDYSWSFGRTKKNCEVGNRFSFNECLKHGHVNVMRMANY